MEYYTRKQRFQIIHQIICNLIYLSAICSSVQTHYIDVEQNEYRPILHPRPIPLFPASLPRPAYQQIHQNLPIAKERSPAEYMVDLSNDLTYHLLYYHSILNRNNFAFSPTALMSVLIALYEGSAGNSAKELKHVLQLPNNHDVIRVGYRDIHRRLRTYFFGSDNPLKGLSLNKENVTITREFESILMFYGYDLGMDMLSSTEGVSTTSMKPMMNETNVLIMGNSTTTLEPAALMATVASTTNPTTTTSVATTAETTTQMPETTTTPLETTTKIAMPTTITTTEITMSTTTETTTTPATTTSSTTDAVMPITTAESISTSTEQIEQTTETPITEMTMTVTDAPTTSETEALSSPADVDDKAELISSIIAKDSERFARFQKVRTSRLPSAKLLAPTVASTIKINYLPSTRSASPTQRSKRHLYAFQELDNSLLVRPSNTQLLQYHIPSPIPRPFHESPYAHLGHEYAFNGDQRHFLRFTDQSKQDYNADVISHVFYLGNRELIHTTFKIYNAVLYYKYFEHLKMSILELELDTTDYNLMIILPDYHSDLVSAAASLKMMPTLRLMRNQLKPRWVQAIIPDFKLHGTMFLTNDMQNMGICDIFEPNRADFRPMTNEKGIYVKHIEQSINISIRTHPINQIRRNYGAQIQPIQISVNHPFLFFIIDRDLSTAVMAGRILNPQNVRIQ